METWVSQYLTWEIKLSVVPVHNTLVNKNPKI